jgi:hypothetical protein
MQRLPLPSHLRQCGLLMFRMFVTGWPPNCGRFRHAPPRHNKLALAIGGDADDRRHLVREDCRQRRQVARAIVLHAE